MLACVDDLCHALKRGEYRTRQKKWTERKWHRSYGTFDRGTHVLACLGLVPYKTPATGFQHDLVAFSLTWEGWSPLQQPCFSFTPPTPLLPRDKLVVSTDQSLPRCTPCAFGVAGILSNIPLPHRAEFRQMSFVSYYASTPPHIFNDGSPVV